MNDFLDIFTREDVLALGWGLFGLVASGLISNSIYRKVQPLAAKRAVVSVFLALFPLLLGAGVGILAARLSDMPWLFLVGLVGGSVHSSIHAGFLWAVHKAKREAEERI